MKKSLPTYRELFGGFGASGFDTAGKKANEVSVFKVYRV